MTWTIQPEPRTSPDAVAAVRAYLRETAGRYWGRPATEQEVDAVLAEEPDDELVPPRGRFLLARDAREHTVAGCAAVLLADATTAELRRVWVAPHARRRGLGARLVGAAEEAALAMGARAVRLDTRRDLVEARRLYERLGYTPVEPFNDSPYAHHWLGKPLRPKLDRIPEQAPPRE